MFYKLYSKYLLPVLEFITGRRYFNEETQPWKRDFGCKVIGYRTRNGDVYITKVKYFKRKVGRLL